VKTLEPRASSLIRDCQLLNAAVGRLANRGREMPLSAHYGSVRLLSQNPWHLLWLWREQGLGLFDFQPLKDGLYKARRRMLIQRAVAGQFLLNNNISAGQVATGNRSEDVMTPVGEAEAIVSSSLSAYGPAKSTGEDHR
jgi:hypothetical protein